MIDEPPHRPGDDPRVRCIVVDDHPAVRAGLRELLTIEPGLVVLGAFATADPALAFARGQRVDVAIVDYQLGGRSGLWLCRRLRELADAPAVVIYSAFSDAALAAASVVAGASGLVSKAALTSDLAARIREAAAGERRLPVVAPALSAAIARRLDTEEQAVFGMMMSGVPGVEIAQTLRMRDTELDATLSMMLRKLERADGR
jgi:DNA-binding NarL/FixJ family response regulator